MRTSSNDVRKEIIAGCRALRLIKKTNPEARIPISEFFPRTHLTTACFEGVDWTRSAEEIADVAIAKRQKIRAGKAEKPAALGVQITAEPAQGDINVYRSADGQLWLNFNDLKQIICELAASVKPNEAGVVSPSLSLFD